METEIQSPNNAQKRSRVEFENGNAVQVKPNGDSVQDDGIYNCRSSFSITVADVP